MFQASQTIVQTRIRKKKPKEPISRCIATANLSAPVSVALCGRYCPLESMVKIFRSSYSVGGLCLYSILY